MLWSDVAQALRSRAGALPQTVTPDGGYEEVRLPSLKAAVWVVTENDGDVDGVWPQPGHVWSIHLGR